MRENTDQNNSEYEHFLRNEREGKDAFDVVVNGPLDGATEGVSEMATKDALSNLDKDAQKDALEVTITLYLRLRLLMHPLHKSA